MAGKMAEHSSKTSLAVKAFELSVAAAQERSANDYWEYLEHIEAPQWIDLALEASLEGTEGDDPWFYQHHPHHETPLEDLVFTPTRASKEKQRRKRQESPTEDDVEVKLEGTRSSADKSDSEKRGELNQDPLWPRAKAKRVQLLPDRTERSSSNSKQEHKSESCISPLRPSDSFTTMLLSTLMARLRTSEQLLASPDTARDSSLSDSKIANQMTSAEDTSTKLDNQISVKKLRIATAPLSDGSQVESPPLKQDKENADSVKVTVTVPEVNHVKKTKLSSLRKSLATFDLGKNVDGAFSIGRTDLGVTPRRRLSCSRSPRLKNPKTGRRERQPVNTSLPDTGMRYKSRTYGAGSDDLAALIAKHNTKLQPKPKYEPRLHSTRDIREWERRSGILYYDLQPVERVKVNQEITDYKRSRIPGIVNVSSNPRP